MGKILSQDARRNKQIKILYHFRINVYYAKIAADMAISRELTKYSLPLVLNIYN